MCRGRTPALVASATLSTSSDVYGARTHPVGDPEGWERNMAIDLFNNIFGVANQFGHTCTGAP